MKMKTRCLIASRTFYCTADKIKVICGSLNVLRKYKHGFRNLQSKFVQVNKDFWEAVKAQLADIRACFGGEPPLVKIIDNSFMVRIVFLSSDTEDLEKKLKAKLEDIYRKETRKMYI